MREWLQNFLETEPPYKTLEITEEHFVRLMKIRGLSITHFCSRCKNMRTFKSIDYPFEEIEKEYNDLPFNYDSQCGRRFAKNYSECFLLSFSCQHDCGERHFITLQIENLKIRKIGQYPTFAKEEINGKLLRYKSLISEYYPELTKAVSAYSQNMGVASFVYLRRILEHLIEEKFACYGGKEEIKFIDKLHEVEKHEKVISDEFTEVKNQIYTVLSKGVHEYDEEECLKLFPVVKYMIESILDEELLKRERAQRAQEAKKMIQAKLKSGEKNDDGQA